jgi:hypothetical protein
MIAVRVIRVVLKVPTGRHPTQARARPIGDGRVTVMCYVQLDDHQFLSVRNAPCCVVLYKFFVLLQALESHSDLKPNTQRSQTRKCGRCMNPDK